MNRRNFLRTAFAAAFAPAIPKPLPLLALAEPMIRVSDIVTVTIITSPVPPRHFNCRCGMAFLTAELERLDGSMSLPLNGATWARDITCD